MVIHNILYILYAKHLMDIKFEMVEHRKILNKNGPTKNRSNKV